MQFGKGRVVLVVVLVLMLTVTLSATQAAEAELKEEVFRARVLAVEKLEVEQALVPGLAVERQLLTVELTGGPFKGQILELEDAHTGHPAYDLHIGPGDRVVVWTEVADGAIVNAYLTDYGRDRHLLYLAGGFILALLVIGGRKGIKTVITLGLTVLAVVVVLLPLMLKGYSPIMLAVLISAAVVTVTFTLIGGWGAKTLAAIIGTVGGVIAAGLMAVLVGSGAQLTGFGSEGASALLYIPQGVEFDFRGILFAGMIIGALGAVMDVGMSVAAAVAEVKKANHNFGPARLFEAGMNVGRDIMGTMANTLILAYTGAAIPLLLLFMAYETPFVKIINLDLIATEVVRALAGSIGLILCVPLTALAAALLLSRSDGQDDAPHRKFDNRISDF